MATIGRNIFLLPFSIDFGDQTAVTRHPSRPLARISVSKYVYYFCVLRLHLERPFWDQAFEMLNLAALFLSPNCRLLVSAGSTSYLCIFVMLFLPLIGCLHACFGAICCHQCFVHHSLLFFFTVLQSSCLEKEPKDCLERVPRVPSVSRVPVTRKSPSLVLLVQVRFSV